MSVPEISPSARANAGRRAALEAALIRKWESGEKKRPAVQLNELFGKEPER